MTYTWLFAFACMPLTACAANSSSYSAPPLQSLITNCAKSENCYVFDGQLRRQVIAAPTPNLDHIQKNCLGPWSNIETLMDKRTEHSGILYADCKKEDKTLAYITLWYFPDGRIDLTLQDCEFSICGERYRPI